jgi:hypothetical protein
MEIDCEDMNWNQLAHIEVNWWVLVNMVMILRIPQEMCNFLTSCTTLKRDSAPWRQFSFIHILLRREW